MFCKKGILLKITIYVSEYKNIIAFIINIKLYIKLLKNRTSTRIIWYFKQIEI